MDDQRKGEVIAMRMVPANFVSVEGEQQVLLLGREHLKHREVGRRTH